MKIDDTTSDQLVCEIHDASGKRKVVIVRRPSGSFYYEEWMFSDEPMENCWIPLPSRSIGVYETLEIAVREAKAKIGWLRDAEAGAE